MEYKNIRSDFHAYFRDISRFRLITKEEEISLCKLAQSGDIESRNKVITANLRLVILIAHKYAKKGVLFEDLISYGNIGLFHAVRKFDTNAGFKFSTYATLWITQTILRSIEKSGRIRIPSYMQFIRKKIDKIKNAMALSGEKNIPLKSILHMSTGKGYKITKETMNGVIKANETSNVSSMDDTLREPSLEDLIYKNIANQESIHEAAKLIESLPDRSKKIIKMRFGIGYENSMTLLQIANSIDPPLTRERIRQIISDTICYLKREMGRIGIDSFDD